MHRRRNDRKVYRRQLLRAQAARQGCLHRCLHAFGSQHLFECLAHSILYAAGCRQQAVIEPEALVKLAVQFFARRKRHILQMHRVELARRRQRKEHRLAVGGGPDLLEKPRIGQLLGASLHVAQVHTRVWLQTGSRKQLLLRVLGCALKANRLGSNFLLRHQGKSAKQKQSDTGCATLFGHVAPRLANRPRFGQRTPRAWCPISAPGNHALVFVARVGSQFAHSRRLCFHRREQWPSGH